MQQCCIQSASLRPGRTDHDSGCTKFERVRQFGRTGRAFGHTKSKHWHPISGFRKLISNLANARKCIQIQIRCTNCRGDKVSTSLIGAFWSVYLARLAQLLLCITAKKISWSCFHWPLKWSKQLFSKRVWILVNVKQLQVRCHARGNQPSPSAIDEWLNDRVQMM